MRLFLSVLMCCSLSTSLKRYLCDSLHIWMAVFFCSLVSVIRVDGSSMSDIVSTGLLKVVWIGCLGLTAGDWFMESHPKNPPSSSTGLVTVCLSCFWVGNDGTLSVVSSIVGWATSCVGYIFVVVGVSIVDLCSSVAGGICGIDVSSVTV